MRYQPPMSLVEGTIEWFRWQKRTIEDHAQALDSISCAARAAAALRRLLPEGDQDILSALHTQAVINYARPFVSNERSDGSDRVYPTRALKRHPGFDPDTHEQLIALRMKVIAHSDNSVLASEMLDCVLTVSGRSGEVDVPVGVSAHVQAVMYPDDSNITDRWLRHCEAAATSIEAQLKAAMTNRLNAYDRYGLPPPPDDRSHQMIDPMPIAQGVSFDMPSASGTPLAQLKRPKMAEQGYVCRTLHYEVRTGGPIRIRLASGEEAVFEMAHPPPPRR
jgi:hypothetical protein